MVAHNDNRGIVAKAKFFHKLHKIAYDSIATTQGKNLEGLK